MNADLDLERRVADYYATEAPPRAPDWMLGAALATIDITPQRRVLIRVPWRFPIMNTLRQGGDRGRGRDRRRGDRTGRVAAWSGARSRRFWPDAITDRLAKPGPVGAARPDRDVHVGHPWDLDLIPIGVGHPAGDGAGRDRPASLPFSCGRLHLRSTAERSPVPGYVVQGARRSERRGVGDRAAERPR